MYRDNIARISSYYKKLLWIKMTWHKINETIYFTLFTEWSRESRWTNTYIALIDIHACSSIHAGVTGTFLDIWRFFKWRMSLLVTFNKSTIDHYNYNIQRTKVPEEMMILVFVDNNSGLELHGTKYTWYQMLKTH